MNIEDTLQISNEIAAKMVTTIKTENELKARVIQCLKFMTDDTLVGLVATHIVYAYVTSAKPNTVALLQLLEDLKCPATNATTGQSKKTSPSDNPSTSKSKPASGTP